MREILITATVIPVFLMSFTALGQSAPASAAAQLAPPIAVVPSRPSEDWNRVRNVAHDEEINVWASSDRHVRCLFTGATDDYLFCEPLFRRSQGSGGEYRFSRADVDKIRLEQAQRNLKRAVVATTVAGAIAGAAITNSNSGGRFLGGVAGGLAGTMAGLLIAAPIAIFVPGHLVYERPRAPKIAHAKVRVQRPFVANPQQAQ